MRTVLLKGASMFRVFIILATILIGIGCRAPVSYGFDPAANRDFWESRELTQVMTIYPGNCERSVSATTPIRFTFSKTVTMDKQNFTIRNLGNRGRRLPHKLILSDDGRTYTAALREPLEYNKVYLCEITGVKDSNGKRVPDMSWTFTTRTIPENVTVPPARWRADYWNGRW
jgi:hypothetical protein